jgi:hypothetical protein
MLFATTSLRGTWPYLPVASIPNDEYLERNTNLEPQLLGLWMGLWVLMRQMFNQSFGQRVE